MDRVNQSPKHRVPVAPQHGFKTHGQSQLKSKTECGSGSTKWWFSQTRPIEKKNQQDQMNFIQQKELKKDKLTTKFLKITVG